MNLVTIPYQQSTTATTLCDELIAYKIIQPSLRIKTVSDTNFVLGNVYILSVQTKGLRTQKSHL